MQVIQISIVDDQPLFRDGIKSLIRRFPQLILISEANSGKAFVDSLDDNIPDFLILDLKSEVEETAHYIKKRFPNIAIIIPSIHYRETWSFQETKRINHQQLLEDKTGKFVSYARPSVISLANHLNEIIILPILEDLMNGKMLSLELPELLELEEKKLISLLCQGYNVPEIAQILCKSPRTIEDHKQNILKKIKGEKLSHIIAYGVRNGLDKKFKYSPTQTKKA